jgi:hypothetical protein
VTDWAQLEHDLLRPDLAELLYAVELFLRRFVVIDDAQAAASTLWVPHTHAIEAAYATPYLHACSAEPESGKTRFLEALRELVRAPILTMNVSDAALFRTIDQWQPTLFFDEVDAIFNPKARERGHRDDLRSPLNAGYRRGEFVLRMGGGNNTVLETFAVFGPKALAGLGSLPPALASRCIRIEMKRRRTDEPVDDFFPADLAAETEELRGRLAAWAETAVDTLKRPARRASTGSATALTRSGVRYSRSPSSQAMCGLPGRAEQRSHWPPVMTTIRRSG